jgi:hypothetical protein
VVCGSQFDKHCSGDLPCSARTVPLLFQKVSKNGSLFCLLTPRCRLVYKWWCSLQVSSHYRDPAAWRIGIKRRHSCDATSRHCDSAYMDTADPIWHRQCSWLFAFSLWIIACSGLLGAAESGFGLRWKNLFGSSSQGEQAKNLWTKFLLTWKKYENKYALPDIQMTHGVEKENVYSWNQMKLETTFQKKIQ